MAARSAARSAWKAFWLCVLAVALLIGVGGTVAVVGWVVAEAAESPVTLERQAASMKPYQTMDDKAWTAGNTPAWVDLIDAETRADFEQMLAPTPLAPQGVVIAMRSVSGTRGGMVFVTRDAFVDLRESGEWDATWQPVIRSAANQAGMNEAVVIGDGHTFSATGEYHALGMINSGD